MHNRFRAAALAGVTALSLTLTACGGDGDSSKDSGSNSSSSNKAFEVKPAGSYNEQDRDAIKDGGELTLPISELTEQQNYFHANANAYTNSVWRLSLIHI